MKNSFICLGSPWHDQANAETAFISTVSTDEKDRKKCFKGWSDGASGRMSALHTLT